MFYESHTELVEKICIDLGMTDKIDYLIEKFLDNTLKLKPKKDPNKPKKPRNCYTYFCDDKRGEIKKKNPKMTFSDINKTLGLSWKGLTDKEKHPYIQIAKIDKNRYMEDLEEYQNNMIY